MLENNYFFEVMIIIWEARIKDILILTFYFPIVGLYYILGTGIVSADGTFA